MPDICLLCSRKNPLDMATLYGARRILQKENHSFISSAIICMEAEQRLIVPGLRAGSYLRFFGIHVLTPTFMEILDGEFKKANNKQLANISNALQELSKRENYLAREITHCRYI